MISPTTIVSPLPPLERRAGSFACPIDERRVHLVDTRSTSTPMTHLLPSAVRAERG